MQFCADCAFFRLLLQKVNELVKKRPILVVFWAFIIQCKGSQNFSQLSIKAPKIFRKKSPHDGGQ